MFLRESIVRRLVLKSSKGNPITNSNPFQSPLKFVSSGLILVVPLSSPLSAKCAAWFPRQTTFDHPVSPLRTLLYVFFSSYSPYFNELMIVVVTPCPCNYFYFLWHCSPARAMASSFTRFLDHTQRRATVGRTPLDEWSARHKDLYLTIHNKHPCPWWDFFFSYRVLHCSGIGLSMVSCIVCIVSYCML
jgi:hypothetical protein